MTTIKCSDLAPTNAGTVRDVAFAGAGTVCHLAPTDAGTVRDVVPTKARYILFSLFSA